MNDPSSDQPAPGIHNPSRRPNQPDGSTRMLLDRAQAGENWALESLCTRYLPRLYRLATGRLPPRVRGVVDTGDLVQESLIRTINNLGKFEPRHAGAFPAYLRKVVLNRIREEVRKSTSRPRAVSLDGTEVDPLSSPLEETIGHELVERYEAALARLKEDDRAILFLKIEMDMVYAEIADVLDKPSVDAARMAVKRAVVRLAGEMDADDET